MIEPGIIEGMVEYVSEAVLAIHRDLFDYALAQHAREWKPLPLTPAGERRVGALGLGMLGVAVLKRRRLFGFDCAGWSRSAHTLDGVRCYEGADEFDAFLARTDVLVCLLPLTDATRGMLSRRVFDALPAGASLVHVGRGPQLLAGDLLDALARGHVPNAVLDVTDPEPYRPSILSGRSRACASRRISPAPRGPTRPWTVCSTTCAACARASR